MKESLMVVTNSQVTGRTSCGWTISAITAQDVLNIFKQFVSAVDSYAATTVVKVRGGSGGLSPPLL